MFCALITDLQSVRHSLGLVGEVISSIGLPKSTNNRQTNQVNNSTKRSMSGSLPSCMIFAFTGNGNVTKGSKEIFEMLPHEYITSQELPYLREQVEQGLRCSKKLYCVSVTLDDLVRLKKGKDIHLVKNENKNEYNRDIEIEKEKGNGKEDFKVKKSTENVDLKLNKINKIHYYAHPDQYESIFHMTVAPYVTVIVNGIYWDFRYPRLLTKNQLTALRSNGNNNLKVIADITCDVNGSFEFLSRTTDIEKPFYTYLPESETDIEGAHKNGVLMLGNIMFIFDPVYTKY